MSWRRRERTVAYLFLSFVAHAIDATDAVTRHESDRSMRQKVCVSLYSHGSSEALIGLERFDIWNSATSINV